MEPKIPEFHTLPPQTPTPQPQDNNAHYEKPVQVSSHVNRSTMPLEGVNFDPETRRQVGGEPGFVHTTRSIEPEPLPISQRSQEKHAESQKRYPLLNLTPGEYVVADIRRHYIGLVAPMAIGAFIIVILLSVLLIYPFYLESEGANSQLPGFGLVSMIILPLILLVALFSYAAIWVYQRNKFYLTNESIIQNIQVSLFTKREQTVSLGSVEDVSYRQNGVLQTMLNYGNLRLSTEGDETTYRYYFVQNPKEQSVALTNAVEDFKNGRPVCED